MHAQHRILLRGIEHHQRKRVHSQANDSYLSSGHHYYDVSIPMLRTLARGWVRENRGLDNAGFLATLDSLYRGRSYEEKVLASLVLSYHQPGRTTVTTRRLDSWLDGLVGWAEVDALSAWWPPDEVLANWGEWKRFVQALARDQNVNKRRAALVFLTAPIRNSADSRLSALALEIIDTLKLERDKIITKAVSWLLRSMVRLHRSAVAAYLEEQQHSLPATAVRETRRKLATGRK